MVGREHFFKTENFNQAQAKFPHLREYVHKVSFESGVPEFKTKLDRSLRKLETPNLIYPVGDPIFIHMKYNQKLEFIEYVAVMPELNEENLLLYEKIFDQITKVAHAIEIPKNPDEVKKTLISLYDEVVEINDDEESSQNAFSNLFDKRLHIREEQYHLILFHLIKDRIGYGKLEAMLRDPYIEDISCTGVGNIWIVHKIFGQIQTSLAFKTDLELNKYIIESSEKVERPVSEGHPIVDAIMPDGSRVNYIFSKKISLGGSSFTIRKFNDTPISVPALVKFGTFSSEVGAYVWLCLESGVSMFVCGETASGKTTTLNAITAFIPYTNKVYSVEQTPELTLPHPVWQHLVTREIGEKTDVKMFDLLLASLRSRPDYIIVGEIRGVEANITFQAMQTGHPVLSTFHAGSVHSMVQRLTGNPIDIPITFIDNLNVVLIQSAIYVNDKVERRILSVTEISKYNEEVKKVLTKEVFSWDNVKDKHNFRGLYNSVILEQKIAKHLGIKNPKEIYEILNHRKKILDKMISLNILDYFEFVRIVKLYRERGDGALPFKL